MRRCRHFLPIVSCTLLVACNGSGGGGGSSSPTSPTTTTPSIDTSFKRLVDGAGNEGPLRFRWIELSKVPAGNLASFIAEVCMDPVPNSTNSSYLASMPLLFV